MIDLDNLTTENLKEAEKFNIVVSPATYETEAEAEQDGFYWYDEVDRWINVNKFNELIGD